MHFIDLHKQWAMVAVALPVREGPDVDASQMGRPFVRDEAVVDVKRALLFPVKVVGWLFLFPVSFAIKVMIAAYQGKLGEHFHQCTVV